MSTRKLTTLSLFTALAMIIFTAESMIPPLVPLPGVKLGLANIITLVLLRNTSARNTFLVLLTRILLSSLLFGQAMSLLYSLAGGVLCFLVMWPVNHLLQGHYLFLTSILGALFHNLAQLAVAFLLTAVPGVVAYLPFLLVSAAVTGLFTGLCAQFAQRYLKRLFPL